MSTERSYVGREHCASPTKQTANSTAKTPLSPDKRQRRIEVAQARLLDLVDEYANLGFASEPISVINDLLYSWLTLPATDFSLQANRDQLDTAFQLVKFLAELYESNVHLQAVTDDKEVVNE